MSQNALDVLGVIAGAKPEVGADYIQAGTHLLEIQEIKLNERFDGHWMWIAEFKVLWSADNVHTVGSVKSLVEDLNDKWKQGPGRAKAFAMAMAEDMTEEEIDKAALGAMVGKDQMCKGFRVVCTAHNKAKKHSEGEVTKYRWTWADPSKSVEYNITALKGAKAKEAAESAGDDDDFEM